MIYIWSTRANWLFLFIYVECTEINNANLNIFIGSTIQRILWANGRTQNVNKRCHEICIYRVVMVPCSEIFFWRFLYWSYSEVCVCLITCRGEIRNEFDFVNVSLWKLNPLKC